MSIQFAGVPLPPPPEPGSRLLRLLEEWWDKERIVDETRHGYSLTGINHLPIPPKPVRGCPRLGVLEWPNDASRFSSFWTILTYSQLQAIYAAVGGATFGTSPSPRTFIMTDGTQSVQTSMYLLAPRLVSVAGGVDANGTPKGDPLYLIQLVDVRFFWWEHVAASPSAPASWTDLLTTLFTGVGVGSPIIPSIPAAYGTPDATRWNVGYQPLPLLIDAACATIGLRLYRSLAGDVTLSLPGTAIAADSAAWTLYEKERLTGSRMAASDIGLSVPAQVKTVFPGTTPATTSDTLVSLSLTQYSAAGSGIASATAFVGADLSASASSGARTAYGTQAATDYYLWSLSVTDATLRGIIADSAWPTGLEDRVEWVHEGGSHPSEPGKDDLPRMKILTRVFRRSAFDRNIYTNLPAGGSSVASYNVRLTGSGVGIDGGIAWKGFWQKEDGMGNEVDGLMVGSDCNTGSGSGDINPYVIYMTKAADGFPGNPEVNDIVVALPDPLIACRWGAIPKRNTGHDSCGTCAWLLNVPQTTCFKIRMRGGEGSCDCVPNDSYDAAGSAMYAGEFTGWIATKMKDTCCGCGGGIFRITDPNNFDATLELRHVHVSCAGGSGSGSGGGHIYSMTLKKAGCCTSEKTGKHMIEFAGYDAQACDDTEAPCANNFYVTVECDDCPPPICDCCCLEESPPAWYFDNPEGSFATTQKDGLWVLTHDDVLGGCNWNGSCNGITANLTYDSGASVMRVTFDGSVYESDIAGWNCGSNNSMTKISGDGLATLALIPIIKPQEGIVQPCDLPDTLTMSVQSAACPLFNTTQTVTRVSTTRWEWTQVVAPHTDGMLLLSIECIGRQWQAGASGQCGRTDPDPDLTYGAITSTVPVPQHFGPLELGWSGQSITGTHPSPVPDCCDTVNDLIITVTE